MGISLLWNFKTLNKYAMCCFAVFIFCILACHFANKCALSVWHFFFFVYIFVRLLWDKDYKTMLTAVTFLPITSVCALDFPFEKGLSDFNIPRSLVILWLYLFFYDLILVNWAVKLGRDFQERSGLEVIKLSSQIFVLKLQSMNFVLGALRKVLSLQPQVVTYITSRLKV